MFSPDGLSPKATAPSIWSFDSGYGSNSLFEEEGVLQSQPVQREDPPSEGRQPHLSASPGLGLTGFWNARVGDHIELTREEPAIEPILTKLSVFTTKDASDNDFFLPEIPSDGEACLECELWKITNPGEDIKCEQCRIPEIIEPTMLSLDTGLSKGKEPLRRFGIPRDPQEKGIQQLHRTGRCSACELSALLDPSGAKWCPSCSSNPTFLSPISPSSPQHKVKRSRAGRNSKLPLSALNRLEAWLDANQDNPYPSAETKRLLAQECGITEKQVTTWFTNARARRLNPLETYLSSGSEDEGARESDIASAADTPVYNTAGFTFISESRPAAGRSAASISGSSAFSTSQPRPRPSRRGKKKDYRRNNANLNQTPQGPSLLSPTSITSPLDPRRTDQEMWQCTFCYRSLVPKSWRRHEETQHRPRAQWTCMLYGPRLRFPARSNSTSVCAFCMAKNPSEEHFVQNHRIEDCARRAIGDRTFFRPDHLRQHVKNFHGASLFDIVQARWKSAAESDEKGWICGFCREKLETWDKRETHIANHFKEGWTMAYWKDYSNTEEKPEKKGKDKQEKGKDMEKDHPHGLARLSRSFTRRSARQSQTSQSQPQPGAQTQYQTPFANAFQPLPTSIGLSVSDAPVLPGINMDPLMMDACGNYIDWSSIPTSLDQQMQYQSLPSNGFGASSFPSQPTSLPPEFDSALNMDLYSNSMDYQGPWEQQE